MIPPFRLTRERYTNYALPQPPLLLVLLERIPGHLVWIFTTTTDGQKSLFEDQIDASPLLSPAEAFAQRSQEIAQREGLDGKPIKAYLELVKQNRNNFRAVCKRLKPAKCWQGGDS